MSLTSCVSTFLVPHWKTGHHFNIAWKNSLWTNICFHFSGLHPSFCCPHIHVSLGTLLGWWWCVCVGMWGEANHYKMVYAVGFLNIRHVHTLRIWGTHTQSTWSNGQNFCAWMRIESWSTVQLNIWPESVCSRLRVRKKKSKNNSKTAHVNSLLSHRVTRYCNHIT